MSTWGLVAVGLLLGAVLLGADLALPVTASARFLAILVGVLVTVGVQHRRRLVAIVRTLPRDVRFLLMLVRALRILRQFQRDNSTIVSLLEEAARRTPTKICYRFEEQVWTYRDVNDYSNRVARAFLRRGLGRGDVVALLMANQIEYICIWLGLAKLGVVTALINYNLRDAPLAHSINAARAKVVLFGAGYAQAILAVRDDLETVKTFYQFEGAEGVGDWCTAFHPLLQRESTEDVENATSYFDQVLYIFTSGTTGLPKPAIITHAKVLLWPLGSRLAASMSAASDSIYCSLPMYHAAGGAAAVSMAITFGVPVVFVRKFSASKFWSDCVKYDITCAQYIGELCRFLVSSPETASDKQHRVRLLFGNGMSRPVWEKVLDRFQVDKVLEFYASTEGNVSLINTDGKVGAIGFLPRILPRSLYPIDVVRVDEESGNPIRDAVTGHCVRSQEGESGMLVGRIDSKSVTRVFYGYLNRDATEKKILKDTFALGDRYFMSGDLVVLDELGYIYFKDRTGDTFRWRGENVSTAEVEAVITRVVLPLGVREVAVYGVQVPGNEGRAGMAALADPERRVDLQKLAEALVQKLPSYARPLFMRLASSLPMTGTHKVSKVPLQKEGFDIANLEDPVYFLDTKAVAYVPLTESLIQDIVANKIRL